MASIDLIRASNGSGDAVKATVTNARVISSTTLQVDATTNWPSKFIATVGSVDGTGAFVPATVTVFDGILSGGNIEITSFAPGYTDIGNTPGQIVVLKPTTAWANEVADTLAVAHSDSGTLKAGAVDNAAVLASNVVETAKIKDGAVTTRKFKPTIIKSNFTLAGARYTNTATNVDSVITNASMTYTAGAVDEKLILTASVMGYKDTGAEGAVWLGKDGVSQSYELYYNSGVSWYRGIIHAVVDVPANTTVTLALYGRNLSGGTFSVVNEIEKWKPSITGFSVGA